MLRMILGTSREKARSITLSLDIGRFLLENYLPENFSKKSGSLSFLS
jgi:hypothetical protein